jgi:hypothetical protein
MLSRTSALGICGRSYMLPMPLFACAKRCKVPTSLFKAERAVRAATNTGDVLVILSVILPEANGTNLVSPALIER